MLPQAFRDGPLAIIPDFLSQQECRFLIDYINKIVIDKSEYFSSYQDGKRLALQFGKDLYHGHDSHQDFSLVIEIEPILRKYFSSILGHASKTFDDLEEKFVSSFWIAVQYPGSTVPEHEDTDSGNNPHLEYSCILYLNSLEDSGDLMFPSLGKSYRPKAGDLVMFPSKTTGTHTVLEINEQRYSLPIWITKDKDFIL
jgi:hypothetical protein